MSFRQSPRLLATFVALLLLTAASGANAQRATRKHSRVRALASAGTNPLEQPAAVAIDSDLKTALAEAPAASQWPEDNYSSLLDVADVTVHPDGTTVGVYRLAYKLFNQRARDIAEVSLPYNQGYQTLELLRARTVKRNGIVQPVRVADIRRESPYSDYLMYDDTKSLGFSMPGVEDGCVVDYAWRVVTKPMVPGQFCDAWTFSQTYPVRLSRFTLHVPADKPFQYKVSNNPRLKPTVALSADGRTKTYTWLMRDIDPIADEPSMPEMQAVTSWLEVTSIRDWQEMARWYTVLMRPQAVPDDAIRSTVKRLTAGLRTDDEKARALYDYVANHVRYVGLEFGISAFRPHQAGVVNEKLYGDCKDKATLLITMLRLAGIQANPVLLQAESRRPVHSDPPSIDAFDHCIALAQIGGKEVWLDATAESCAYGDIPASDRGCDAFVIRDGSGRFEVIPSYSPQDNCMSATMQVTLRPDRSADIAMQLTLCGGLAQEWRERMRSRTPTEREQAIKQMAPAGAELQSYAVPDGEQKDGPFVLKLTMRLPRAAKKIGNLLIVGMPATLGLSQRNPYPKQHRTWPVVNSQAYTVTVDTTFTLPDGYTVEELPEPSHITGPLFDYAFRAARSQDGNTIRTTLTRGMQQGEVLPSDYPKLRACHEEMIQAAEDQMIVLRKAG